ncbi:MAG: hypothetical protein H6492_02080 [Candidatus Paracaedibacteraceae bacterium]|nr:hypothetical protein [Candidatus Paracaedibacteraceae bacterium]
MMHLRARLLITGMISLIAGGSVVNGADEAVSEAAEKGYAESGTHTPVKAAAASAAEVDPTPGQKVAERQREVFVRERFEEVFGAEVIERLTCSKGIRWDVLMDTHISFQDATKRLSMHNIKEFLRQQLRSATANDACFKELRSDVLDLADQVTLVHEDRLEEHARRYFTIGRFEGARVELRSKIDGDQLGSIVIVRPVDGPAVKYYVKTHAGGVKTEKSTGAKRLNIAELMVYKVLEGFGVGCETHFFGRDGEHCYIATRDAGAEGEFEEYYKIKENKGKLSEIWGALNEVLVNLMVTEDAERERIEAVVAEDPVAQNFLRESMKVDVLARLMLLTDLQTNGRNFGFVHKAGAFPVLRAIDFRLHETDNFRLTERDFGGFLAGNGLFHYASSDKAVRYALRERSESKRLELGRKIFSEEFRNWLDVLERAKMDTREALLSSGLSGDEVELFIVELEAHTEILKENFRLFEEMLRSYR